ncbi:MAG: hypothetical protein ABJ370_14630 [Paracoccaceae bacterium]
MASPQRMIGPRAAAPQLSKTEHLSILRYFKRTNGYNADLSNLRWKCAKVR